MAALTPVPVTLADDKVPTKQDIKNILATFLPKEWPSVDAESLNLFHHASFANAHIHVERPQPPSGTPATEPLKLFIKLHSETGGCLHIFDPLAPSKQDEARLCEEYGRSGLGAKVYGFFQTQDGTLGRIDEFLDARNLEPEDVEDAEIRADIARGFATFHSMAMSLEKKPVEAYYSAVISGLKKYHRMEKLKSLANEGGVSLDALVDYDFAARLQRVVDRLQSIGAKTGWCIHDVQFMNVLVKNNPPQQTDTQKDSRVVLIDFEFVMQNYRAFDIGGHYMQKLFKWFDETNKIADCRPFTEDEKRHFCDEYATRWNECTSDKDTGAQVFAEGEYGYLLALTFDIHNMLCYMDEAGDKDPLNLLGLNKMFDEFVAQYAALKLEEL